MKALSFGKSKGGLATLEILIAFSVLMLTMTAVILVVFSNQTISLDTQISSEALSKAQAQIEVARGVARKDFAGLQTTPPTQDDVYQKSLLVESIDTTLKKITSTVSWSNLGRALSIDLVTFVTDRIGSGACMVDGNANWQNPEHFDFNTGDLMPVYNSSGIGISDIKVSKQKMYVAAGIPANSNHTFYVFDLPNDPEQEPVYLGSLDNAPSTQDGLNAVALGGEYAYVASAHDANFQTCSQSSSCAQLQVIDINNSTAPVVVKSYKIPSATAPFVLGNMTSTNQGVGKSVFYSGGYVYLGLTKTASGPEFHIIDVHDPLNPFWVGSFTVGRTINSITVKGRYAYLSTTENNNELLILDVNDKANPTQVGLYNAAGSSGFGYGKGVSIVGDTLYFGRSFVSNSDELYILDNTNPGAALPLLGSQNLGTNVSPDSVNGIVVKNNLLFLLTNKEFQVWDVTNPSIINPVSELSLADFTNGVGVGTGTAINCSGNYFYIALVSPLGNDQDIISILTPGSNTAPPLTFDYTLTPAFTSLSVSRGASVSNNITVSMTLGTTSQEVMLVVSGMQSGVTTSMSPASGACTPNTSCVVLVTFIAATNAEKVTNTVTIAGADPTRTTTFELEVTD